MDRTYEIRRRNDFDLLFLYYVEFIEIALKKMDVKLMFEDYDENDIFSRADSDDLLTLFA